MILSHCLNLLSHSFDLSFLDGIWRQCRSKGRSMDYLLSDIKLWIWYYFGCWHAQWLLASVLPKRLWIHWSNGKGLYLDFHHFCTHKYSNGAHVHLLQYGDMMVNCFDKPVKAFVLSDSHPLVLTNCTNDDFCLCYTSPKIRSWWVICGGNGETSEPNTSCHYATPVRDAK